MTVRQKEDFTDLKHELIANENTAYCIKKVYICVLHDLKSSTLKKRDVRMFSKYTNQCIHMQKPPIEKPTHQQYQIT